MKKTVFLNQRRFVLLCVGIILVIAVCIFGILERNNASRDVLWKIVRERCVPNMSIDQNPSPCTSVSLLYGQAIYKDRQGNTQYLLIPTTKVSGIESPGAWGPNVPNYFAGAWAAAPLVNQKIHRTLPRTDFALAINSVSGRSQDQLHIHIDCIRPDIKAFLEQNAPQIGTSWRILPMKLRGHEYRALWLPGEELGERNPFQLLASSLSAPSEEMRKHTLVLVGAAMQGRPGFVLLDGMATPLAVAISPWIRVGSGSGEELEDHGCTVASQN